MKVKELFVSVLSRFKNISKKNKSKKKKLVVKTNEQDTELKLENKNEKETLRKKISKYKKDMILKNSLKISSFKKLFLMILGFGLILNFPAYYIFGFEKFNLGTVIGFGTIYYFIKDEFIEWFRSFMFIIKQNVNVR